jgi:hypothetical protein
MKKVRLNLDLDAKTKARLDDLKDKTSASSLTDVIRRSLARYYNKRRFECMYA